MTDLSTTEVEVGVAPSRHRRVILRELVIALGVLVAFLFLGRGPLGLLRISAEALTVSGGVILLLIALRMIFPSSENTLREEVEEELRWSGGRPCGRAPCWRSEGWPPWSPPCSPSSASRSPGPR